MMRCASSRLVSFLCVWLTASAAAAEAARPNIVIILADDMGYGDVHALSPKSVIATPHLDRIAAEGMTFTDGHSPSAVCTPTRYGLLTGRYCWRTSLTSGVLGGYSPPLIDGDRVTIAQLLQENGYRTGAVGKWHLGMALPFLDPDNADTSPWDGDPGIDFAGVISDSPIHHGFGSYFGVSASLDMAPFVYIRDDRFTALPTIQQAAVRFPYFVRKGPRAEDFEIDGVLDRLTEEAVRFVEEAAEGERPFFLYMPLTAPHKPTQPHERFRGTTGLGEYGDFVAQVDWTVGQVLDALDRTGSTEDTLLVYTSDNGSYMFRFDDETRKDHVDEMTIQGFRADRHRANGPFRGTKADIWEAGHHVPLLVRWPGNVAAGSSCDETVCLTDLFATVAEIVGVQLDNSVAEDSFSLASMLAGEEAERGAPVVHHSVGGMFAIREGDWKLVLGNGSGGREKPRGKPFEEPYQLFNLAQDIGEEADVAAEHPEVADRLTVRLEEIRERGRSVDRTASR